MPLQRPAKPVAVARYRFFHDDAGRRLQFLIESVVLCLGGGLLGIGVGIGGSWLLEHFAGWKVTVAPDAVMLAIAFSATVGIFFGLWPARRAAGLSPLEALRYE